MQARVNDTLQAMSVRVALLDVEDDDEDCHYGLFAAVLLFVETATS